MKRKVMERDGFKCQKCGKGGMLHVHHLRYGKDLLAIPLKWLVTLCKRCHEQVHREKARERKANRKTRRKSRACVLRMPVLKATWADQLWRESWQTPAHP